MNDALKVVVMWGAGLLIGLLLRLTLPAIPSLFIVRQNVAYVLPLNRLAFWSCLTIGFIIGLIPLVRVMAHDLIPR
jgi:hypothetical protein